ncbi:hypothetical protein VTO42DRAFT_5782 [Malbranchea cinnamomea]
MAEDDTRYAVSIKSTTLENRVPNEAPIVSKELLNVHARISKNLAWIEAAKYVGATLSCESRSKSWLPSLLRIPLCQHLRRIWITLPCSVRSRMYDALVWMGFRLYGTPASMTTYRLPFGLYFRRGSTMLAEKYRAEAHTLRLIEQSTCIPAPRAIDAFHTSRCSYLLMTRVPGRPIGEMLNSMTDEQVEQAVVDLKCYINQLRQIPNNSASGFLTCNAMGSGILDWRIPDSQREQSRFKTESDFNTYLTRCFNDDVGKRAAVSHNIPHAIVFTHGDLNPRNILALRMER